MKKKSQETKRTMKAADLAALKELLEHPPPGWRPNPLQAQQLGQLLNEVERVDRGGGAGLGDRVVLVNPYDPDDSLELRVVLPQAADPDRDELSVYLPVSLAVLGCEAGDWVTWETPRGERRMMVESVEGASEEHRSSALALEA